jgi:hypothetical protein
MDLQRAILTDHAREQLADRQLTAAQVQAVLNQPAQVLPIRPGRVVAQAPQPFGDPARTYLVRVVVDIDRDPPEVVTAYRTSKIDKYRSRP